MNRWNECGTLTLSHNNFLSKLINEKKIAILIHSFYNVNIYHKT